MVLHDHVENILYMVDIDGSVSLHRLNALSSFTSKNFLICTLLSHTPNFKCIERERNVLFNDALNTFYLPLYSVRHMVKNHSDSEKGNPLPPHRLLLSINSKGSFICTIPQTG